MIKAVIFDCFGVLTTDLWLSFCDSLPAGADVQAARDLNKALDRGMITRDEFTAGVLDATGRRPPIIEGTQASEVHKNELLLESIRQLKQAGYKIGLLSNIASDWITTEFLAPEEQAFFDEMVFSYQVGMTKPDPRIYMLTCERLRVGPHEALMVDDRPGFIEAARAEGLQGIVYEDFASFDYQLRLALS